MNDPRALIDAARGLCNKLEVIVAHPAYKRVFECAYTHGQEYDGPSFKKDLADLQAVLDGMRSVCPICDGSGEVFADDFFVCPKCNGTGKVD